MRASPRRIPSRPCSSRLISPRPALLFVLVSLTGAVLGAQQTTFLPVTVLPETTNGPSAVRVYYATDRMPARSVSAKSSYLSTRSPTGQLSFGTCIVTIPESHVLGTLETAVFDLIEDPTKHVVLQRVDVNSESEFFSKVQNTISSSERNDAFVFVHGYNTTFKDAARRTAQIVYDLKFDGAPIFYSWPSQGRRLKYPVDETNVEWSIPHLATFLRKMREQSGARRMHLIAHSLGARALVRALDQMNRDGTPTTKFNQVILAAPDIDTDTFVELAAAIGRSVQRITLYASSKDLAMTLSKRWHGYPRAGDSGEHLVIAQNVDTIDATSADTDADLFGHFLGHSYFSGKTILSDVFMLVRFDAPPAARFAVFPVQREDRVTYWQFHP